MSTHAECSQSMKNQYIRHLRDRSVGGSSFCGLLSPTYRHFSEWTTLSLVNLCVMPIKSLIFKRLQIEILKLEKQIEVICYDSKNVLLLLLL